MVLDILKHSLQKPGKKTTFPHLVKKVTGNSIRYGISSFHHLILKVEGFCLRSFDPKLKVIHIIIYSHLRTSLIRRIKAHQLI